MIFFSKIAAGEIPSYKCAENDKFYAFLDINPLVKGHTLVIPRREVDYIFDMDDKGTRRIRGVRQEGGCRHQARIPLQEKWHKWFWTAGSGSRSHPSHPDELGIRCQLLQGKLKLSEDEFKAIT